ncbi:MAG: DUF2723 domain-containing protein [Anaerolineales bacterium]|nr:DUF2723 domain-containing protein [Anaerolineales bacterium]
MPLTNQTPHASRITYHASRYFDSLIGLTLFLAGLYAYTATLAPTVLEGDAALYQYTPYVLGVTYPTGYPFYILLGKLWLSLFPFGEVAWRMNLFSALCSAAALPLIYGAARRFLLPSLTREGLGEGGARFAALAAVLTFATLPTFWRWSTEAKIYSLNILLFSGVLYTLASAWEYQQRQPKQALDSSEQALDSLLHASRLTLPALLLGLQIAVHSTTVLLLPGLLLFAWLYFRPQLLNKKLLISYFLFLISPGLLYLYIPLRAEALIAQYGRSEAIAHGLLADFYHSGPAGWIRYFTAADFTGGVVTNWGQVPQQFIITYLPILKDEVTLLGISLGLIGGLALAITRPRLFWPLFLCYAAPIPFVLTYGQGEQSAFLLPSLLIFSIFLGYCLIFVNRLASYVLRFTPHSLRLTPLLPFILHPSSFILLFFLLFLPQTRYNLNWLQAKWDRSNYTYWADALAHPLEPGASLLAQWGDLTSFWYMQHVEKRRPDLRGLYPPTAETAAAYLQNEGELYMAGPASKAWIAGIEGQTQLLPWGRLVRLAPPEADPQTLLPTLPYPQTAVFDQKLRLLGADFPPQAVDGRPYGVTLTWQTLADLPPETTLSLRLSQGDVIAAQLDDALVSGWFPHPDLSAGQYLLSYVPIPIQLGTLPGQYRLQLVAYTSYKHPWPLADGATLLDLGEVELTLPPAGTQPDNAPLNPSPGYDFNGELELTDYEYTVTRVGQGKGFGVKLLWRAQTHPADNYTLLAELVDARGNVLRSIEHQPVEGRTATATWQPGQFVRDQVDFVLPASAPVGRDSLRVRLSWLRPDGSRLQVRWRLLPLGESLDLNWLEVTEKEGRLFEPPQIAFPLEANFDNKVKLLGYKTSLAGEADLQWGRAACVADAAACSIHFEVYWQGLSEMDQLYFVFLHLVDAQGKLVRQQDKGPGLRGKEPTTSWLPGEVITDPIDLTLPPDLLPGHYTLRIGLYLPPTGPRLPVLANGDQPIGDYVEIGTIEVIP